jgi:hypothetical protein
MKKKMVYLLALILGLGLFASSKDCVKNCTKKPVKKIQQAENSQGQNELLGLSPFPYFTLYQI